MNHGTGSTDFTGPAFDFAVGEVYGMRIWNMDDYGRLRARHMQGAAPWRPGVNTAVCVARDGSPIRGLLYGTGSVTVDPAAQAETDVHAAPDERCTCGFYAYTHDPAATYESTSVTGVIRGTGRTLIGTKGFRTEKAEIVALLDPTSLREAYSWQEWVRDRLQALYPQVPLLGRGELRQFAPIVSDLPAPTSAEFWALP